jgi:hypothetical protein
VIGRASLAAALVLAFPAPALAADHALSSRAVTSVDAFGGRQLWDVPGRGGWRLYSSSGAVHALPVERSTRPFEADLGARLGGGIVAVYTRCRANRGCSIYRYDFTRKRERRERGSHRRGCRERHASSWRGALVFVRSGRARCKPGIYLRGAARHARARRIAKLRATATDVRGRLVLWQDRTRVGKLGFGGEQAVLSTAGGQGPRSVSLVGLDGGTIYFHESRDPSRSILVRVSERGQSREEAELAGQRRFPGSAAVDGRRYFYRLGGRAGRLFEADPFPFPGV